MRLRHVASVWLLLASTASASVAAAPPVKGADLRYVRAVKDRFVLESRVTEVPTKRGTTYVSLTDRGSEKMTLTVRFDDRRRAIDAEAAHQTKQGTKTVRVVFGQKEAVLTRKDRTERLAVTPDVVVTTAPDWSDVFLVMRRYDHGKGGKQAFAGLWIHPTQATLRLTFTAEAEKDETIAVGDRKFALKRFRVTLRSGAYLVWADRSGRVYRLAPPGKPAAAVILEGFERATQDLR
jgi:hypothetical protein